MLTDTRLQAIKPPATGQEEHADHKITGLRLRVGAGGAKTWTLRRRVGSKTINKKLGNYPAMTLAAARNAAEAMIASLEQSGSTEGIDRTFGQAARYWLDHKAKDKNRRWQDQQRQLELHVYPRWKDRKLSSIRKAEVRELVEGLEGKVLPNRILALLKTVFRYAAGRDWIEHSPADAIEKPNSEKARDRVLSMQEVARVWQAAELLGYPFAAFTRLLLLTAQRRGEVAGMRWADVDLVEATWTIPADDAKAGRANLVPLSPDAVAIIKAMPNLGEYIFTLTGSTPISGFAKAKSRLDLYLAKSGDPLPNWRFHDLRRTAATNMVRLGIPEAVVGRVLNHAVTGVTAQVYALHSYAPEKRHALEAWAAEIASPTGRAKGDNVGALRSGE